MTSKRSAPGGNAKKEQLRREVEVLAPFVRRQIEHHLDQIDAWRSGRRGTIGFPATGERYAGKMVDEIARHERDLVDLGHQPTIDYVRLHGFADGTRGVLAAPPSPPPPSGPEIERERVREKSQARSSAGEVRHHEMETHGVPVRIDESPSGLAGFGYWIGDRAYTAAGFTSVGAAKRAVPRHVQQTLHRIKRAREANEARMRSMRTIRSRG